MVTYLGRGGGLTLAEVGYPPRPGVDRQTPVKTVPSRRTTYAGDNKPLESTNNNTDSTINLLYEGVNFPLYGCGHSMRLFNQVCLFKYFKV